MLRYYRDIKSNEMQNDSEKFEMRTGWVKKHKACNYQINYSLDQYPVEGPEIDDDGCEFGYSMAV